MAHRTSTTDPLRIDWVAELPIGLTLAPGRRGMGAFSGDTWERDLDTDLQRVRSVAGTLVTLMEPRELAVHGIASLPSRARRAGLRHLLCPIPDGGTPPTPALALAALLSTLLDAKEPVVVHCLGGLGRSGLVVGCLLIEKGWTADDALAALRAARGPRCPETPRQVAFVRDWAERRGR